jgi:peptide/nickel transport system substrate-binding protein
VVETVVETVVVEATPEPEAGGGTLILASNQDIDNFDPHWNQLIAYEVLIGHNVFEYLTKRDKDMRIAPGLAESWEISDDGTVYTFHLREGATFHNGRPVTAEDVVFTFNRLTEQETTFATKMDPVESVEALDEQTVQFNLKSPWAPFLEDVAVVAIVAEETVDTLEKEPIGSGPFRFVEWIPNDQIVLEKNPDYDVPGVPKLDQIIIKVLPDYAVALTNLEAGSVDAVYEVPAADADRFQGRDDIIFQMPDATNSLFLIEMAIQKYEPLQDARVRRALAMTMDKAAIREIVYFGFGEPQWSSLPKSSWAYIEPEEIPYDPEAAQALLAEAGYPDGFELSIKTISGVAVMENMATIWQDGLSKAGVTLNVEIEELSTWLDHYVTREYQTIANWMNVHGDPHSMYDIIFKPHLTDETSYPNEEMLSLIEEGATTTDQGRRKAIYARIQQMAVEEMAPVIIVQSQPLIALTNTKVKGWTMNGKGDIFFDSIYMEE